MATGILNNPAKQFTWTDSNDGLSFNILRVGNVCTLFISNTTTSAFAQWAQLTSSVLPSGYHPIGTLELVNYDLSYKFYLNNTGLLRTRDAIPSGVALSSSVTYVTQDADPS